MNSVNSLTNFESNPKSAKILERKNATAFKPTLVGEASASRFDEKGGAN